jgi:hypothetical protein
MGCEPLSVSLFNTRVRCSIPIFVTLSRIGERPRPASFRGICTPSVEKLGRRLIACLIVLLSMPSIVVSFLSLNIPRYVAWYLDLRSCSIAIVFKGGLSLRLARALTSFFYAFSDVVEVFSKVKHGIDVDPEHFVLFGGWSMFDMGAIFECDIIDLFLYHGMIFVFEGVAMGLE